MISIASIIGIGWFIFWLYWLISAAMSKRTIRTNGWWRGALIRVVLFIIIIWLIQAPRIGAFFTTPANFSNLGLSILGVVLWVAGIGFAVWARVYLGKNWGMPMTIKENRDLVTGGPYHYARHPIYTGVIVAIIGSIFIYGLSWLVAAIFFGIYFIYSARIEEKILTGEFPAEYPAYQKRTKMLIPFVF
jgi:protein-S-isoprenylcysteine O-methyltransferase Ste14